MGTIKVTPGTWLAPLYGWTRQDYEAALLRAVAVDTPCYTRTDITRARSSLRAGCRRTCGVAT